MHNCQADAVSRLPSASHTDVDIDEELPCFMTAWPGDDTSDADYLFAVTEERPQPVNSISTEKLLREQQSDELCRSIRESIDRNEPSSFSEDPVSGLIVRRVTRSRKRLSLCR